MMKVRVGVPLTGGRMVRYFANNPQIPLLFSANAFFGRRSDGTRYLRPVNLPEGLDAALDSAGYVAQKLYGHYPWSEDEYLDLVASYPWSFYSTRDYCVEPEIAKDRKTVRMRLAATISGYYKLSAKAADRGLPKPMPVLQGAKLADYLYCAEALPCDGLVGLGSFCRRDTGGEDGIVNIIEKLSDAYPKATWHAFGCKGQALGSIGNHPSMESCDSMAYDVEARNTRRTGRTIEYRMECMERWLQKNLRRKHSAPRVLVNPSPLFSSLPLREQSDEVREWMDLVEDGVLTLEEAGRYMTHMQVGWQDAQQMIARNVSEAQV